MYATLMIVRHECVDKRRKPLWKQQCCTDDGGGPAGTAIQVEVSNHLKVLWPKSMVLSVEEKAVERLSGEYQGDE